MRKQNFVLVVALGISAACMVFASCKHVTTTECTSCTNLPANSQKTVSIANGNYSMKVWNSDDYHFAYTETSSDLLKRTTSIVGNTLGSDENLATIVFYVNPLPQDNATITTNEVLGYGMYFLKEGKLRYRFYLKSGNQFKVVPELNCEVKAMSSNNIYDISNLYFGGGTTALAITCRETLFMPNTSKSNSLEYNIQYLYRKLKPMRNGRTTQAYSGCVPPCSGSDHDCDNSTHGWSCDYTTTQEPAYKQAATLTDGGVVPQSLIDSAYNPTIEYNFRDSFLFAHTLTRKYVDYYYGITPEAYLTSAILSRMPAYLLKINTKAMQILTNQTSVVLIDAAFRDETISLLELYKAAAPNATERGYFQDVENDVTHYTGKTIGQIMTTLD